MAVAKLKANRQIVAYQYRDMAERIVSHEKGIPTAKQRAMLKSLIIDLEKTGYKSEEYLKELDVFSIHEGKVNYERRAYSKAIQAMIKFGKEHGMFENYELKEDYDDFRRNLENEHRSTAAEKYLADTNDLRECYGFAPIVLKGE